MGVAWVWSTLSELFAYPNGSGFPLGQRGSDNRGWTVVQSTEMHATTKFYVLSSADAAEIPNFMLFLNLVLSS